MRHCHRYKLTVFWIELTQFHIIWKLGIASIGVLLDMYLRNKLRVSRVLM